MYDWAKLEQDVRTIAEIHWNSACEPRTIDGVRIDGVIEVKPNYWVAIEISKSDTLDKLRTDLAKFAGIRLSQMSKGIFVECLFITLGQTSSLKETGKANHVDVMSLDDFSENFVGKKKYEFTREKQKFGSAVDPDTGEKDDAAFAPVKYIAENKNINLDISQISQMISAQEKIILLGEFGSGKSRCVQEVFNTLRISDDKFPILAINLRDCWGLKSAELIIRSHLEGIGVSDLSDNVIKLASNGKVRFLLDGFDEIGSQSWTGEIERLITLRRSSLVGVHDLISKYGTGGFLLTGREHYFSSDEEMLECLGLKRENVSILKCRDEFNDSELKEY